MTRRPADEPDPRPGAELFDDQLLGLDPDEPEVQDFAAHLDRMQRHRPAYTVEASLRGVGEFADSANRAESGRRWAAVALVVLLLVGVVWAVVSAVGHLMSSWLG